MAHLDTLLASAGIHPDLETGGLAPPIHLSTTFERDADGSYPKGFRYTREGSPTRAQLERTLAAIEGGSAARAFASGLAASVSVLQTLPQGGHVIIPDTVYHGFLRLVEREAHSREMRVSEVDMTIPDEVSAALTKETRMIWVETPSNPLLKISDLGRIADIARGAGAVLVVDGSWTTPVLQKPFDWGADLVVHSLTKYMAGHSDVLGGAVVARNSDELFQSISDHQKMAGAVLDPFSAWLTLRGIRTLAVRLMHQCATAGRIAHFLDSHANVKRVHYPGLPSHPNHEVAARQMQDFGAMLAFEVDGGAEKALAVAAKTRVFTRATSLGGTESLIEHRASIEAPASRTPEALLRLSIGLEHPADLIDDLDNALINS